MKIVEFEYEMHDLAVFDCKHGMAEIEPLPGNVIRNIGSSADGKEGERLFSFFNYSHRKTGRGSGQEILDETAVKGEFWE